MKLASRRFCRTRGSGSRSSSLKVVRGPHALETTGNPLGLSNRWALRAVPVVARVVRLSAMLAGLAHVHVPTESRGATANDGIEHRALGGGQTVPLRVARFSALWTAARLSTVPGLRPGNSSGPGGRVSFQCERSSASKRFDSIQLQVAFHLVA